jgi:S-adenosylmethionine:tRNA ribosyltransferase-isomerase
MYMHPKQISIKEYSYSLPEEKIATYPLSKRDDSKLLIYEEGNISEDIYLNIDSYIPANSLLVFNDTKVIEARLLFIKPSGGTVEIFCLEPHEQYPDITAAMSERGAVQWKCLVGGASKWKHGQILEKRIVYQHHEIILHGTYKEKRTDHFVIYLSWLPRTLTFAEILQYAGAVPLPPYIKRDAEPRDAERYQTIYAEEAGSVAAPTAGLHFTSHIFEKLRKKNVQTGFVTLHVGAGTFKPVKTETIADHEMHAEFIDVSLKTIENIYKNLEGTIVAVGTTSLRTIESLYWIGVKLKKENKQSTINTHAGLSQWEAYDELPQDIPATIALQSLLEWMRKNKLGRLMTKTQIIIVPGYKAKVVTGLVTNFHQPGSTLLLLVAALIGEDWKRVYDYALTNQFRFLSYGDGSLLWCHRSF